jgi:hypothetical protein
MKVCQPIMAASKTYENNINGYNGDSVARIIENNENNVAWHQAEKRKSENSWRNGAA